MGMKISVLYLGRMEFPKFRLVQWDDEVEMIKSPAVAILIQHPTLGNLLYDTGNSPDHARVYTPDMLHNYPVVECISIKEALAAKGLTPDDIDRIIISHLHFDHAAGLNQGHQEGDGLRGRPEGGLFQRHDRQRRGLYPGAVRRGGHSV